jgi:hypothetical protein
MNNAAYKDGYEVGKRRGGDINIIKRAIRDCQEMGWDYLLSYFLGQQDAIQSNPSNRQEILDGSSKMEE